MQKSTENVLQLTEIKNAHQGRKQGKSDAHNPLGGERQRGNADGPADTEYPVLYGGGI